MGLPIASEGTLDVTVVTVTYDSAAVSALVRAPWRPEGQSFVVARASQVDRT